MELFFKAKIDPAAFLNGNYIVRVYSKMKISKFLIEYHVQTFKLKYCIGKSDLFCTFEYLKSIKSINTPVSLHEYLLYTQRK